MIQIQTISNHKRCKSKSLSYKSQLGRERERGREREGERERERERAEVGTHCKLFVEECSGFGSREEELLCKLGVGSFLVFRAWVSGFREQWRNNFGSRAHRMATLVENPH